METSPLLKSSHPSCPSPDGKHLATLSANLLSIRRISTFDIVRTIELPSSLSKIVSLRWSPVTRAMGASNRILLADEDAVRVWDLQDNEWSATVDNGSGGMGKIANVEFGSDDTEVLVFSSFNAQLTVWSLWTGRSVEIKDPKFAAKGHGRLKNFALLSRSGTLDIITLHAQRSYEVLKSFSPPTVDAQGLKWSPDGKWLAVWDTASTGYKVFIYTADGHLYRSYAGDYFDDEFKGLGVKTIEWSPNGDFLAIGGYEQFITLLSTRTFSPAVHLSHANSISPSKSAVYVEHATPTVPSGRTYTSPGAKTSPPTAATGHIDKPSVGTSMLAFNSNGTLLASKDNAHPTTVWIWDLANLQLSAILVQLSVVKKFSWHPSDPDVLLIQCIQGEGLLYLWDARANADSTPRILDTPSDVHMSAKAEVRWLRTAGKVAIIYGDVNKTVIVWPDGREPESPQLTMLDNEMAQDDDDSLYNLLSCKNGELQSNSITEEDISQNDFEALNGSIQDTFDFRRGVSAYG